MATTMIYSNAFDNEVMDFNSSIDSDWESVVDKQIRVIDWAEEVEREQEEWVDDEEVEREQEEEEWIKECEAVELQGSTFYNEENKEYEVLVDHQELFSSVEDDKEESNVQELVVAEPKMTWAKPPTSSISSLDDEDFPPLNTTPPKKNKISLRKTKENEANEDLHLHQECNFDYIFSTQTHL